MRRSLAIPIEGRRQTDLSSPSELPTRVREELKLFFITAAALEGKDPRILSRTAGARSTSLSRGGDARRSPRPQRSGSVRRLQSPA
jgi:hypothetical protein